MLVYCRKTHLECHFTGVTSARTNPDHTNYALIHHALNKAETENEMMNHQIHHEKTSKKENKKDMGALFLSRTSGV